MPRKPQTPGNPKPKKNEALDYSLPVAVVHARNRLDARALASASTRINRSSTLYAESSHRNRLDLLQLMDSCVNPVLSRIPIKYAI